MSTIGDKPEECPHHGRIIFRSAAACDLGNCNPRLDRAAVIAVENHRVERIRYRHNTGGQRNIFAGEALGIARAIPILVMVFCDQRSGYEQRTTTAAEELSTNGGVPLALAFLIRVVKTTDLQKRVGEPQLAKVVKRSNEPDYFGLRAVHSNFLCQFI